MVDILIITFLAIICGLMGAWTGAGGSKLWRRVAIPLVFTVWAFLHFSNLWVILIMSMAAVMSLGYGIPTPPNDPGSPIGSFWYKVFKGNEVLATAFTRATIGVLMVVSVSIVPLISAAWWPQFGVFAVLMVFNQVLWTVLITGLGTFNFLGKTLNKEEFFLYSTDAVLVLSFITLS